MRRLVCLVAFVGGLVGADYAADLRRRPPVAILRSVDDPPNPREAIDRHALRRGAAAAWWART